MVVPASSAPAKLTALIAGASGLVGGQLVRQLCAAPEYGRVIAVSRQPLVYDHPRLANRIVRFDALEQSLGGTHVDVAFCCLGTTLRTAGSREAFRHVDHHYVVTFARAAHKAGATRFVLLSSVGADKASRNFYLRVKGETEAALEELKFQALDII